MYPWQGAVRSLKRQMAEFGLVVLRHTIGRWRTPSFSGLMVYLHLDPDIPPAEEALALARDAALPLNGFLAADVVVEMLDQKDGPPQWILSIMLLEEETETGSS